MQHVRNMTTPLEMGQTYLVDTVKIQDHALPVLGPAHMDETTLHLHLDQRFMGKKLLRKFGIALLLNEELPIAPRPMQCVRQQPEIPVILSKYREIYKNSKMKNRLCPHQGTYLGNVQPINGCVTCPMHGLSFHCNTGENVDTPTQVYDIDLRKIQRLQKSVTISQ